MKRVEYVAGYLPVKLRDAIISAAKFCGSEVSEIHIVKGSGSSIRLISRNIYLGVTVSERDIEEIVSRITGRALYAYRDTIKEGYLSLEGGIRVGVCGQARYEGDRFVGISRVTSLLIRLPRMECPFVDRLLEAFMESERGLLIFAPGAGGKTTALRALIRRLGENRAGRISLIDERGEIADADFLGLDVDVFSGYRRGEGMQIALRVMSPEILAVDEIGTSRESEEMLDSLLGGARLIATAHARSFEEVKRRKNIVPFIELGVFDRYAGIYRKNNGFECEIFQ